MEPNTTYNPAVGNHTGTVTVEMTPSQWIDTQAQNLRKIRVFVKEVDSEVEAIKMFLDLYLKNNQDLLRFRLKSQVVSESI